MPNLTVERIAKLKKVGMHGDGGGLYLNVAKGGSKSWIQRIQVDGKRVDKGLGGYPAVSLSQARRQADANRVAAQAGENPWPPKARVNRMAAKQKGPRVPTFKEATQEYYELNHPSWKSAKHRATWLQSMELYVFPDIGDIPIDEVTSRDILAVLHPLWPRIPDTAMRLRHRMRAVFRWAVSYEFIESNPAGERIDGALPRVPRSTDHYAALHYSLVPEAYWKLVRTREPGDSSPRSMTLLALRLLILTAARSAEVRHMTWDELAEGDTNKPEDGGLWVIPAARMKAAKEHRVPLSPQAMTVLKQRKREYRSNTLLVFFSERSLLSPIGENALGTRCRIDGLGGSAHGFRSSFRDWAAEQTSLSREAAEMCLAHTPGNRVERAYFRSDLLDQRRELMNLWGEFVETECRAYVQRAL